MKNLNNILSIFLFAIFVFLGFATEGEKKVELTEEQKAAYAKKKKEFFEKEIVGKKIHMISLGYCNSDDWIRFNADKSFELVYTCLRGKYFKFIGSYDEESYKINWKTKPNWQCERGQPRRYFANEAKLYDVVPVNFYIDIYTNSISGNEYYEDPFTKEKFYSFLKERVMFEIPENGKCNPNKKIY